MARFTRNSNTAARSVIRVGDGRGFVVRGRWPYERIIITAAHCLHRLPTGFGIGFVEERTYGKLLAGLGQKVAVGAAECLFVDPVSDLAVLGPPDSQVFDEESDAYAALVEDLEPLVVSAVITDRDVEQRAWMLSLAGDWFSCMVKHHGGPWWPAVCAQPIEGGMSGSPILDDAGAAIGVVTASSNMSLGSPNPRLCWHLPAGLLAVMSAEGNV